MYSFGKELLSADCMPDSARCRDYSRQQKPDKVPAFLELRDRKQEITDVIGWEGKDVCILTAADLWLFLEMEPGGQRKAGCVSGRCAEGDVPKTIVPPEAAHKREREVVPTALQGGRALGAVCGLPSDCFGGKHPLGGLSSRLC